MKPWANLKSDYERDGYVIARNVLDAELIAEVQGHVRWLIAKNPNLKPDQLSLELMRNDPFWVHLVSDPRLLDVAEAFIGPDIAIFASHYICKPPKTGRPVLWHQDGSYWPLEPMEVVTLWLAGSESVRENGCMRVIPGTQNMNLMQSYDRRDVDNVLGVSMDERLVDESRAVDIELKPGDVSIHHPNIIHGSEANTSDKWRIGLTIRYIPTTTRVLHPNGVQFLMRGKPVPGINEYLPPPAFDPARHYAYRGASR